MKKKEKTYIINGERWTEEDIMSIQGMIIQRGYDVSYNDALAFIRKIEKYNAGAKSYAPWPSYWDACNHYYPRFGSSERGNEICSQIRRDLSLDNHANVSISEEVFVKYMQTYAKDGDYSKEWKEYLNVYNSGKVVARYDREMRYANFF